MIKKSYNLGCFLVLLIAVIFGVMPGCDTSPNHTVRLYSGGGVTREWKSSMFGSWIQGTYCFKDEKTGQWVCVSGNVVVEEIDQAEKPE